MGGSEDREDDEENKSEQMQTSQSGHLWLCPQALNQFTLSDRSFVPVFLFCGDLTGERFHKLRAPSTVIFFRGPEHSDGGVGRAGSAPGRDASHVPGP